MYICIAGFIPVAISAILSPIFSLVLSITNIVLTFVNFVIMLITLKYIREGLLVDKARMKRITARTCFSFQTFPIFAYLIIFLIGPTETGIVFTYLDYTIFIFWGVSFILNVIGAILYKLPKKKQSVF